jgi:CubicO group peptidase (beta-lactamase class C family)
MRKGIVVGLLLVAAAIIAAGFVFRPDKTIRVATGLAAKTLCSDVFISGLDPATVFAQAIEARPGVGLLAGNMHFRLDQDRQELSVDYFGHFTARAAYRKGLGCLRLVGNGPIDSSRPVQAPAATPLLPEIAGAGMVEPTDARLRTALDQFFAEPADPPHRWLRAVVVLKDGQVIAERYAPGIGVDTPLIGYSATKSVISTLVGVLVRMGRLKIDQPAPVAAWSEPGDPRHAITVDNLLRMTSGLDIAQTGSGFDPAARMLYTERDMAAFAESKPPARPPGTRWDYSDASTLIVSRIVRDAVGRNAADVLGFARRELFDPLGMRTPILEVDATGTPVGSTGMLASARDWARLGYLYAHDGVVGGHRILPEGWGRYAATPTLDSDYGAGFWTNAGSARNALGRILGGMPCDTLFASGVLGQRVYVLPSRDLVIARLAVTQKWPDFDILGDLRFILDVLATLPSGPEPACARIDKH